MCDTLAALSPTLMDPGDQAAWRGRPFNVNRTASPLPSPGDLIGAFRPHRNCPRRRVSLFSL